MKIMIVAGGTGGHIYPGIAIAEEIKSRDPQAEIIFLGSEEGLEKDLIPRAGFKIRLIKARALIRKISYKAITAPFVSALGFFQALRVLWDFRPQGLVSTGGYASLAAVLAAKLLGIPVFVHEQNVLPGMTNRLCFRLADEVFFSFDKSLSYHRGKVVGNPVRKEILNADREDARKKLGLSPDKKMLLVMGGSQGARAINNAVTQALPGLDGKWEIFHVIGTRDYEPNNCWERIAGEVPAAKYPFYHPFAYLYNVAEVLAAADMVVSRAGATAIAEFTVRGLPMILIPFPYSAEGHQDLNARVMAEAGAGATIRNSEFNSEKFVSLMSSNFDLVKMGQASLKLARPAAARDIVDLILKQI